MVGVRQRDWCLLHVSVVTYSITTTVPQHLKPIAWYLGSFFLPVFNFKLFLLWPYKSPLGH